MFFVPPPTHKKLFDIQCQLPLNQRPFFVCLQGVIVSHTIQAMSEYERKHWVEAMGGTWPAVNTLQRIRADSVEENLNSLAFTFLKDCLNELEDRGLNDQGLYRVGGVVSKVKKLLNQGLDPQPGDGHLDLADPKVWESKTIASAVKQYFRDLSKPLMTHTLYNKFIEAVKLESDEQRMKELQGLVHKLPIASREILKVLIRHLSKVASRSDKNLMTASNLGVCFGPTLLRPREETVASIMDIKFSNQVVEILIENCDTFFSHSVLASDSSPDVFSRSSCQDLPDSGRGRKKREKRGSSTPKRTQSFSSFSQLSTSSLPDIKEFKDRALAALSAATSRQDSNGTKLSTTELLNNRFRSKSTNITPAKQIIQSVLPTPSKPVISRPGKTNNEQLIESLEMMKNLAADLPSNSPLKRSHTIHVRKLSRQTPVSSPLKKPPLPKASPEPPASFPDPLPPPPPAYSSNSSSACSSNNGSISQHHHRPPPPIPSNFLRQNSVPALPTSDSASTPSPTRPKELPNDGKDTPPPIPVRRYRRIYVNPATNLQIPPPPAEYYSSESSELNPAPPVPAPRMTAASPRPPDQVTAPSPQTADSGIAMSPPLRKIGNSKRILESDTVSVGSSLSQSDDSKYDNLSASSSTSLNSGGHNRVSTSTLVHAAAEIAAANHTKSKLASQGEDDDYQSDNEDSEDDEVSKLRPSRIRRLSTTSSSSDSSCSSVSSSGSSACCCCENSTEDFDKEHAEIEINDHCVLAQRNEHRKSGPYENFSPPPPATKESSPPPTAADERLTTFQRLLAAGQTSNV